MPLGLQLLRAQQAAEGWEEMRCPSSQAWEASSELILSSILPSSTTHRSKDL